MKIIKWMFYYLITDRRGEYVFEVKGHKVIATFTEEPNKELFPRIREILLGDSHIRHTDTSDSKIEKTIKEAV
jgi:hypothetical protein